MSPQAQSNAAFYRPPAAPQNTGNKGSHWYPTEDQLKSTATLKNTLRIVLDQFYALQDQHDALKKSHDALSAKVAADPPSANGPATTKFLGLNVEPVDTNSLANGAILKYNKAKGTFSFQ